jgi:hypothetical protein
MLPLVLAEAEAEGVLVLQGMLVLVATVTPEEAVEVEVLLRTA